MEGGKDHVGINLPVTSPVIAVLSTEIASESEARGRS